MWLLLALLAALSNAEIDGGYLHAGRDGSFVDEHGRMRILHGGNRVMKAPPWYFQDMANSDREFELMRRLGFSVLRLGFMWSGYNPAPGVFNRTYADVIRSIVSRAQAHGIYTLLDMHEDVFSSKFCLYDGIPLWVANKSVSKHPFPWPLSGNCSSRGWMENMLAEAAATAYQDLYDNRGGMLDDLGSFWAAAAREFANVSSIIGYEIINEPFAGNFYTDPLVLLPGVAGSRNLQKMYDSVARRIRQHDLRHIIFFEPVTWGMIFDGKIVGSGFSHVPGGEKYRNRSAFSYHYYCDTFVPSYSGKPRLRKVVCDETVAPLVFTAVQKETRRLGGAAMMTEGLACDFGNAASRAECEAVMTRLDEKLLSWTDYGVSQGSLWQPSAAQQEGWARTHARAIAGRPRSMTFDPVTKAFELCFEPDPAVAAPTEIFASLVYSYPGGRAVTHSPNLRVEESLGDDIIRVHPAATATNSSIGCVRVRRQSVLLT